MTCIADANVLFPLLVQGHAAYETAKKWWDEQPDGTVGTCLITRLAVLCLLTNREPTPNLWADAWLAALAMSLEYELTAFDRGFKSFRGLKLRLLEIPDR
jgi:predicted nucleic acid-binding protein